MKNLLFHFWQLENVYLRVKPIFWNEFNSIRIIKNDSWRSLSKKLHIIRSSFLNYRFDHKKNRRYMSLESITKLINYCKEVNPKISLEWLENEKIIDEIRYGHLGKKIKNPKFPFNFLHINWAKIMGSLVTDGCVQKDGKTYFINKDLRLIRYFVIIIKNTIGDFQIKIVKFKRGKNFWYRITLPKLLGISLIKGLNWMGGNKVKNDISLPSFIKKLDPTKNQEKKYLSTFLRWVFTCDGWVNGYSKSIGISFNVDVSNLPNKLIKNVENAPRLLKDIKNCLEKLEIYVGKPHFMSLRERKDGISAKWNIEFYSKKSLNLFCDTIGFKTPEKLNKLYYTINKRL